MSTKNLVKTFAVMACLCLSLGLSSAHAVTLPDPVRDMPLASKTGVHAPTEATVVLAGGCFWGVQAVFQHVKGVTSALSGYAGGSADNAHYDRVSTGTTGHAESVKITYDSSQISLGQILKIYFAVAHNPTELDHQGLDHGTQYRSVVFYETPEQKDIVQAYIDQLQQAKVFDAPIVTKLEALQGFYPAEDYHQNFAKLHPNNLYIATNDLPKVHALQAEFPNIYTGQ